MVNTMPNMDSYIELRKIEGMNMTSTYLLLKFKFDFAGGSALRKFPFFHWAKLIANETNRMYRSGDKRRNIVR